MPGKLAHYREAVADAPSTNANVGREGDRQNVLEVGRNEPDQGALEANMSGQAQTDTQRITSFSNATHNQHNGGLSAGPTGLGPSQSGNHSHEHSLHMHDSNTTHRALESSIWDWDTPLDTIGESASYYYEPQGELAQEHRAQGRSSTEFSIPHSVSTAEGNWKPANSEATTEGNGCFVVPKRPSGVPPPTAGVKRKSASESDPPGGPRPPEQKRASRRMSDGGDDETPSPMDQGAPAHFTRPQSTSSLRGRGLTETRPPAKADNDGQGTRSNATAAQRRPVNEPATPMVLPPRKVFPIQIGDKLFRLSGASISSDGRSARLAGTAVLGDSDTS